MRCLIWAGAAEVALAFFILTGEVFLISSFYKIMKVCWLWPMAEALLFY